MPFTVTRVPPVAAPVVGEIECTAKKGNETATVNCWPLSDSCTADDCASTSSAGATQRTRVSLTNVALTITSGDERKRAR